MLQRMSGDARKRRYRSDGLAHFVGSFLTEGARTKGRMIGAVRRPANAYVRYGRRAAGDDRRHALGMRQRDAVAGRRAVVEHVEGVAIEPERLDEAIVSAAPTPLPPAVDFCPAGAWSRWLPVDRACSATIASAAQRLAT